MKSGSVESKSVFGEMVMRKVAGGVEKRRIFIPEERGPQKDLGQHFSDSVYQSSCKILLRHINQN